jgi:hypothetical protein
MTPDGGGKPGAEFRAWGRRWIELAEFEGPRLLDPERRMDEVAALWREPVPGSWQREPRKRLLDPEIRYCRSISDNGPRGEHAIEYEILDQEKPGTSWFGKPLVDGVNALPLAKDAGGGRSGNVEADMLVLVSTGRGHRLLLVEVKAMSNNAWYAAIENLRQLRLFKESGAAQTLFHSRRPELALPQQLPVAGVVLAPEPFYLAPRKQLGAVAPTRRLLRRMQADAHVVGHLAVWDPVERSITGLKD